MTKKTTIENLLERFDDLYGALLQARLKELGFDTISRPAPMVRPRGSPVSKAEREVSNDDHPAPPPKPQCRKKA